MKAIKIGLVHVLFRAYLAFDDMLDLFHLLCINFNIFGMKIKSSLVNESL